MDHLKISGVTFKQSVMGERLLGPRSQNPRPLSYGTVGHLPLLIFSPT